MPKEEKISLLVLIIVAGFASAVAYHYVMGYYFGKPFPASTFLFNPGSRFFDFTNIVKQSAALDPFGISKDMGGFAGAPFGQFVGYLFSVVQPESLRMPLFFGSFFVVLILMVKHYLYGLKSKITTSQLLTIIAIVFMTYPVLFAVDRGNFDLLVCASLLLFAFTYTRQQYKPSTFFLALAIAFKPYTVVLVLIYVFDKRYRETLLVVFNAAFLTILSLALFKEGLFAEAQKFYEEISKVNDGLAAGSQQTFASDLYGFLTVVGGPIGDILHSESLKHIPHHPNLRLAYAIMSWTILAYFAIHLWQKPKPLWKTLSVLAILSILLPYASADYRLTYLFAPMLIYLSASETSKNDLLIVILWGLLLIPKNYYNISGDKNIGVVINPLLLIGLLACIVPGAFSIKGITSASRSVYQKLQSIGHIRKLEDLRLN